VGFFVINEVANPKLAITYLVSTLVYPQVLSINKYL